MALPDLSGLLLHEGNPPVPIGADADSDSDDDLPLSKRAARFDIVNPNQFKQPRVVCEARRQRKTLVAKLLQHRGSNQDKWGKGAFDSQLPFLEAVQFLRQNTLYPRKYKEIEDLRSFQHWDSTALISAGVLCEELRAAADRLAQVSMQGDKGYYVRRDWSCKRVFVIGDIHGSLHSLLDILLDMIEQGGFKTDGSGLLADDVAVVCLGDLLDRSPYTLECLYVVLRLMRENPDKCVLTAGNHETDEDQWENQNGTKKEIVGEHKNTCPDDAQSMLRRMKNVTEKLPSSLIAKTPMGTVQFNHGSFEEFYMASQQALDFLKFVQFEDGGDVIPTVGSRTSSPLQWGDVGIADLSPQEAQKRKRQGRPQLSALEVSAYLKNMGMRMLVRGHSDMANLSLLYREGTTPSKALQEENAVDIPPGKPEYPIFGWTYQDPRAPENKHAQGNIFVRNIHDFTNQALYDMYTLEQAHEAESFDKSLVTEEDENQDLLSVTVASCPFSKPMAPTEMMSCYLIVGV